MIRLLSSTTLALTLCLLLAAVAIAGSLLYGGNTAAGKGGTVNVFRSPLFLAPALLLVLNVLVCAARRLGSVPRAGGRAWTFAGIHGGIALLAAGLMADGLFGFVGTQYYPVGVPHAGYHNWRTGRDEVFPFTLEVSDVRVRFHPMSLRIGVRDPSGNRAGPFDVREGMTFHIGSGDLAVTPRKFDMGTKTLSFDARAGRQTWTGLIAGPGGSPPVAGYTVVPVAFHDPEPAGYAVRARFSREGRPPAEETIEVNAPAVHDGISFCLVGLDRDRYGNTIVGIQMTREPGSPLFWAGALLFAVALAGHLYVKRQPERTERETAEPENARGPRAVADASPILRLLLPALAAASWIAASPAEAGGAPRVIAGEETWHGEVRVEAPVTVEKGGILTIRPATTVLLSGEDRDGDGCRDGYIQVLGSLSVEGEPDRPVLFRRLHPDRPWEEIFLLASRSTIRHALVEGATWGLHAHFGDVRVDGVTFRGNEGGARTRGTGASFSGCTFKENGTGLRFWDGGPRVTGCVFEGNGTGLFYREGAGGARITGSLLANREWNLKIGDWARGDLDASGNYWLPAGGSADPRGVGDFREDREAGRIVLTPALTAPPPRPGAERR